MAELSSAQPEVPDIFASAPADTSAFTPASIVIS